MAARHRIRCIRKADRQGAHERILSIGGVNWDGRPWILSLAAAIAGIESGTLSFYVTDECGYSTYVIVALYDGHKYLKTENDGLQPGNLLSLPECPWRDPTGRR
ncbi:DUF3892 domain-containing protein [Cupriavidus basilensis]|uniref:DUF3892 domain-containing protein n=1 Tax=Cupriavidus basilensis TaxID=68895 RepID=UPI0039F64E30